MALREERERCKTQLYDQGFYPLAQGEGPDLYERYENTKRKISSTYQNMYRERLEAAIREFHESINTIEIARQLSRKAATKVLTLPAIEFELRERATIASMLFKPIQNDKARIMFVRTLARLCHKQETWRPKAAKRKAGLVVCEANGPSSSSKRKKGDGSFKTTPLTQHGETAKEELDALQHENPLEIPSQQLYPLVLPHPVCLICIGNEAFTDEQRMRCIPRKDVLNN